VDQKKFLEPYIIFPACRFFPILILAKMRNLCTEKVRLCGVERKVIGDSSQFTFIAGRSGSR